ncbi:NAD(P)-binding protein, partial [Mycena albidolilacea]
MGIPLSVGKATPKNLWAVLQQSYFCGAPTWTESYMSDLSGQVIVVTGGNSGLGKETVRALLQHNATVYMACRSRRKAEIAISELRNSTGKDAIYLELDLANLSSIKTASQEFLSKETKLHILYNNAGIMVPPIELVTSDGYDLTFGTNVLGHFYLTKLLLPALLAAAASNPGAGRVVNLTSVIHYIAIDAKYNSFKDGPARRKMHPADLYSQSKWANAVFSAELARRYGDKGLVSIAVNPGNLRTNLSKDAFGLAYLGTAKWGVLGQLWAGTSPEGATLNGKYVAPWGRIRSPRADVEEPHSGTELWTWLEEQL